MQISLYRGFNTYTFNSEGNFESGYDYTVYLTGSLNWGLAPLHRITQRGPFQDGDSDIDYRLDPRVLSLPIVVPASTIEEHLDRRNRLLQVFKPGNDTLTLGLEWSNGQRSIDLQCVGGLSMDTDSKDFTIRTVVQLRAADPTWYDLNGNIDLISSQIFGTPTPYPKPYPVPYGADSINKITSIVYNGSWIAYPSIVCVGPATNLTIVDAMGNIIQFTAPIASSDVYYIDLAYGQKTVYDINGVNKFADLSSSTNLVNWGLYPDPTVGLGVNDISVSATGTDSFTEISLVYYTRYIGV